LDIVIIAIKIYGSISNARDINYIRAKNKELDALEKNKKNISTALKQHGIFLNSILNDIVGTPEIKRLCEELVKDPSLKTKLIPIIVEKMVVFRESEVKYNLQFVLDMNYLINPLVVNYIKNGGAKNFGCVVERIRKDERKKQFDEAIIKAGISKTEFDIYGINIVNKYLAGSSQSFDEVISNVKEIIEQRNNKKVMTIALLEGEKIDPKQEEIAEELKQFWNNDSLDANAFVSSLVRKLHGRKRKPNPIFTQEDSSIKKKSKKEKKRKSNDDDEEYTEGKKRKTKSKSKSSKKSKIDPDEVDEMEE